MCAVHVASLNRRGEDDWTHVIAKKRHTHRWGACG